MKLGIVYHMPFWRDANGSLFEIEGSFARYVDSLAPYFDEVVLCVPESGNVLSGGTRIHSPNVRLAPLPYFEGPVQFYPRFPIMASSLLRFARDIDVLHCRVPTPAAVFVFALARLFARPRFVLIVGDLRALMPTMPYVGVKRALWRAYTAIEERCIQWMADHSVAFANGPALAAKHTRAGYAAVIQTQTTTIDDDIIDSRADTCTGERTRLLTVSRIDPRKGVRLVPDVIRHLVDRGRDVSVQIIGPVVGAPGERERDAIAERARSLNVTDRITLSGGIPLDQLLPLYRQFDLFVLPTLPGEGVPRVLLEAMAAGLPVVTTRVAGIPGLVVHDHNGILVDTPSALGVADAIDRVISDSTLRRRLIANGYATARQHTLEAEASRMMQHLSARLGVALRPSPVPAP